MSFTEGLREFKAGRYEKAIEFFSRVTEENRHNHKAWNALGVCYSHLEKYEEAERCFRNAIAASPDSDIYLNNCLKNKRKIAEAGFQWEHTGAIPPNRIVNHL
jgi:Flp pilus assembly protein TadD